MNKTDWEEYLEELRKSKQDYCLYSSSGIKLTLTPIIEAYSLPTGERDCWVAQHWQAMPKPKVPDFDRREFGYFIFKNGTLDYKTIPAEMMEIEEGVKIIPLQYRGRFIPNRNPTAVNYFPNTILTTRNGMFLIRRRQEDEDDC